MTTDRPAILHAKPRAYRLPKDGSSEAEYEDALARSPGQGYPRRFAVADGASESSFARSWAESLVEGFVRGTLSSATLAEDIAPLQEQWRAAVARKPLPWHAVEKVRAGAFAALVGLSLDADGRWQALAVGDCCLLHLRDDRLLRSFPLTDAAAFDNRPRLLSSNPERNGHLAMLDTAACGVWQPGDSFLLMSDALAAHALRSMLEEGRSGGETLHFLGQQGFRRWAAARRVDGLLRNDDLALIRIPIP